MYIEGRLIVDPATGGPRIWTRQDCSPAASFEIHADLIRFLGAGRKAKGMVLLPPMALKKSKFHSSQVVESFS